MTSVSFGGAGGSGFTAYFPLSSSPIGFPTGRAMASGSTQALMALTSILVSGNGAARSGSAYLGPSSGSWSAANSGTPSYNGVSGNYGLVNGGSGTLTIYGSGSIHFGRAGSGTTTDGHTSFGNVIGGTYDWVQAPTAPTITTVTSTSSGTATVTFSASSDDGGSAITSYELHYSTTSDFSSDVHSTTVSPGANTISGLVPGATYYFKVGAHNAVTDAASDLGAYSNTMSVTTLAGIFAGRSGAWVDCAVFYGLNGQWVPCEVKAGRAGSWVALTD